MLTENYQTFDCYVGMLRCRIVARAKVESDIILANEGCMS